MDQARLINMDKISRMATHEAKDVINNMKFYATLKEALADFSHVVGMTARHGKQRLSSAPEKAAEKLVSITKENKCALVFGPEDTGLLTEDVRLCHELVTIPTANFSSLNLAQAVMVMCYEVLKAQIEDSEDFAPRMATRYELDPMYDQVKEILVRLCCIDKNNPDYWMNNIRRFFTRLGLKAREVNIIRGVCRQIDWYGNKCYNDGMEEAQRQIQSDNGPEPVNNENYPDKNL